MFPTCLPRPRSAEGAPPLTSLASLLQIFSHYPQTRASPFSLYRTPTENQNFTWIRRTKFSLRSNYPSPLNRRRPQQQQHQPLHNPDSPPPPTVTDLDRNLPSPATWPPEKREEIVWENEGNRSVKSKEIKSTACCVFLFAGHGESHRRQEREEGKKPIQTHSFLVFLRRSVKPRAATFSLDLGASQHCSSNALDPISVYRGHTKHLGRSIHDLKPFLNKLIINCEFGTNVFVIPEWYLDY